MASENDINCVVAVIASIKKLELIENILLKVYINESRRIFFSSQSILQKIGGDIDTIITTIRKAINNDWFPNNIKPIVDDDMTLKDSYGESFDKTNLNLILLFDKFGGDHRINYDLPISGIETTHLEAASGKLVDLFIKLSFYEDECIVISAIMSALIDYFDENEVRSIYYDPSKEF